MYLIFANGLKQVGKFENDFFWFGISYDKDGTILKKVYERQSFYMHRNQSSNQIPN